MKISLTNGAKTLRKILPLPAGEGRGEGESCDIVNRKSAAFTMMEIAISLAVIGIALVAIIGVLPIGMNVQQDNRQETIVGQDASVLMEAIRNGSLGYNDLTNYVYAISNYWAEFEPTYEGGALRQSGVNGYTYSAAAVAPGYLFLPQRDYEQPLTNAANIIGLLSTPEFTDPYGNPLASIYETNTTTVTAYNVYSNHIVAYAYSISGPAIEKPPQDNPILQQDSFSYRVFCVNAPYAVNTNDYMPGNAPGLYEQTLANNLHELRLTFEWPQLPNGNLGSGRQTFRTEIAGQLQHQPFSAGSPNPWYDSANTIWYNTNFYYYQPQLFTNAP